MKIVGMTILAIFAGLVVIACGDDDDAQNSFADDFTAVVRQELASGGSEAAPEQLLELTRVIIPVGAQVTPHFHPGTQLAFITEGTLTYTVIDGEAGVTRAADSSSAKVEIFRTGDTLELQPGDSIREPNGMVHMASNDGDEPVVIYLSSLFPEGQPASSPAP